MCRISRFKIHRAEAARISWRTTGFGLVLEEPASSVVASIAPKAHPPRLRYRLLCRLPLITE